MGRKLGDPFDPLLVSVRSGAKFSMPGMMDTVLNLGLNDESVKGLANVTDDERFAYDSYRRFIAMYGRIVLGVDGELFEHPLEAAKAKAGVTNDADLAGQGAEGAVQAVPGRRQEGHRASRSRRSPASSSRGAVEAVFASWNGARAIAYRVRERISHDLGTAVNVQAMVFGNRDDNSGTGVGFTRNAATGENKPYGDFLINAQGEDVVAGIRNTEDLDHMKHALPRDPQGSARHLRPARGALPGHVRHRVHHRAGQALDAADPRRQAHRRGRAEDGRRHDQGLRQGQPALEDHPGGGDHPRHRRAPRPGAAPAVRGQGQGARQGSRRLARCRGRQGVLHRRRRRRRRRRAARRSSWSATRPAPKTCTA